MRIQDIDPKLFSEYKHDAQVAKDLEKHTLDQIVILLKRAFCLCENNKQIGLLTSNLACDFVQMALNTMTNPEDSDQKKFEILDTLLQLFRLGIKENMQRKANEEIKAK